MSKRLWSTREAAFRYARSLQVKAFRFETSGTYEDAALALEIAADAAEEAGDLEEAQAARSDAQRMHDGAKAIRSGR